MGLRISWKNDYRREEFTRRFKSTSKGISFLYGIDYLLNQSDYFDRLAMEWGLNIDGIIILHQYHDLIVPLFNIKYYQTAVSHENLEYRSIGAEFLAQQKGGHLGLRVDMIVPDEFAIPMFLLYEIITTYSKPTKDFDKNSVVFNTQQSLSKQIRTTAKKKSLNLQTGRLSKFPVAKTTHLMIDFDAYLREIVTDSAYYDEFYEVAEFDIDSLRTPYRRTVTFMTRETAQYNVYVETIRLGKRAIDGPKNSVITLLFREFRPSDKRIKEMKFMEAYTRNIPEGATVKDAEYESKPVVAVRYEDNYAVRNQILERMKEKMKNAMLKSVSAMLGIPMSSIKLLPERMNVDIIDVPEFYDFIFNVGISMVGLFAGRDKILHEFRVGGHVLKWT